MNPIRRDEPSVTQQACEWFFALPKADAAQHAEFGAWLKESPRHVEEFLLVTAAYRELDHVSAEHRLDTDELRAQLAGRVMPLRSDPLDVGRLEKTGAKAGPHRLRPQRRRRLSIAAVAVGLMIGGWLLWAGFLNGQSYSTGIGEMRSFELSDGSVIELNTRSRVTVQFSAATRDIQLLTGEALFKVARNPARPFRVHAGSAVIQAVGTQFNVYRRSQGTTVSIIEGVVRVSEEIEGAASVVPASTQTLAAGQAASIGLDGHIMTLAAADTAKATAWRERRLIFHGERLADVAAEFNRYNRAPQIRVEGEAARSKPLAGIFDADDPESLLLFLRDESDLSAERRGDEVVIRSRIAIDR